jgi:hypothetical protein
MAYKSLIRQQKITPFGGAQKGAFALRQVAVLG